MENQILVEISDDEDLKTESAKCSKPEKEREESCSINSILNSVNSVQLPSEVPQSYDFNKYVKTEVFGKVLKIDKIEKEEKDLTRLPLKKRKFSIREDEEQEEELINYPAKRMISIAELEETQPFLEENPTSFKTPAQRKEMPPLPEYYRFFDDQFNFNNPTVRYHMNNVHFPFFNPLFNYSVPPILVPVQNFQQKNEVDRPKKEYFLPTSD